MCLYDVLLYSKIDVFVSVKFVIVFLLYTRVVILRSYSEALRVYVTLR